MSVILLTVSKPKNPTPKRTAEWSQLLATVTGSLEGEKDIDLIGESSVSIRGSDGLYPFAQILVAAHKLNFSYKVDLLEGKESWKVDSDG